MITDHAWIVWGHEAHGTHMSSTITHASINTNTHNTDQETHEACSHVQNRVHSLDRTSSQPPGSAKCTSVGFGTRVSSSDFCLQSFDAHAEQKGCKLRRSETLRKSRNPTTVVTASKEVHTNEEAKLSVRDLDLFVTVRLLDDTRAVLSLGKLCEEHGYSYEWASGQKPHLTKRKKNLCQMELESGTSARESRCRWEAHCGKIAHHYLTRSNWVPRARFPHESHPCDTLWRLQPTIYQESTFEVWEAFVSENWKVDQRSGWDHIFVHDWLEPAYVETIISTVW